MRILIYGGNKFVVRYRLGDWNVPTEILEDKYGLPLKDWAFGLGVLDDESFIILRRRQIGTANREYPFTILLSPDEAAWKRFGWNAAKMIISLLGEQNRVREKLFGSPESIMSEDAAWLTNQLPPPKILPQTNLPDIAALIVGSIFEDEPIAVNSSKDTPYPSLTETAQILESLPPFLRGGKGFFIGGSVSCAKYLGVNFVFNFQEQQIDEDRIPAVKDKGYRLIHDWQIIEETPKLHQNLIKYAQTPVWLWEKSLQQKSSEFFERLNQLAELVDKREITSDEEFLELKENAAREGILAKEQQTSLLKLICSTARMLSPTQTEYVLNKFDTGELSGESVPSEFLERETYWEWLAVNKTFPSQSEIALQLDSLGIFRVCSAILASESQIENIPALFKQSLKEFPDGNTLDWKKELADTAFRKTQEEWFKVWQSYRQEPFFSEFIKHFCVEKARPQIQARVGNWQTVYLIFADDDGGQWLNERLSESEIRHLIKQLKNTAAESVQLKNEASRWLQKLHLSPLRNKLSLTEKREISLLNNDLAKSWQNFIALSDIFGKKSLTKINSAPPEEIPYLTNELKGFLQNFPKEDLVKKAGLLERLFGELPLEIALIIRAEKTKAAAAEIKTIEKEAALVKQAKADEPVPASQTDEQIHLARIAAQAGKINSEQAEITEAIFQALSDTTGRKDFLKNFWQTKKSGWKDVFPLLPLDLRAEILLLLRKSDSTTTENLLNLYDESLKADEQTVFQHALWETLLYSKAKKELRQKLLQKRGRDRKTAENLMKLFNLPVDGKEWILLSSDSVYKSEEAAAESGGERIKQWFKRSFQRTKNLFGYDDSAEE